MPFADFLYSPGLFSTVASMHTHSIVSKRFYVYCFMLLLSSDLREKTNRKKGMRGHDSRGSQPLTVRKVWLSGSSCQGRSVY